VCVCGNADCWLACFLGKIHSKVVEKHLKRAPH